MKKMLFIVAIGLLSACSSGCKDKDSCKKDKKCKCWCSRECGYRTKEASDNPVYKSEKDDSYGRSCYCNPWDYDHYKDNCILKKKVPEPGK